MQVFIRKLTGLKFWVGASVFLVEVREGQYSLFGLVYCIRERVKPLVENWQHNLTQSQFKSRAIHCSVSSDTDCWSGGGRVKECQEKLTICEKPKYGPGIMNHWLDEYRHNQHYWELCLVHLSLANPRGSIANYLPRIPGHYSDTASLILVLVCLVLDLLSAPSCFA